MELCQIGDSASSPICGQTSYPAFCKWLVTIAASTSDIGRSPVGLAITTAAKYSGSFTLECLDAAVAGATRTARCWSDGAAPQGTCCSAWCGTTVTRRALDP